LGEAPVVEEHLTWSLVRATGKLSEVVEALSSWPIDAREVRPSQVEWMCDNKDNFLAIIAALRSRQIYVPEIWRWGFQHQDHVSVSEYLSASKRSLYEHALGGPVSSSLFSLDPALDGVMEHLEYAPLVNARAHALGGTNKEIMNADLKTHFHKTIRYLCWVDVQGRHALTASYFLLTLDRLPEAATMLERAHTADEHAAMQRAYIAAYMAYGEGRDAEAKQHAEAFVNHPVLRWRRRFEDVMRHIEEAQEPVAQAGEVESFSSKPTEVDASDLQERQRRLERQGQGTPTLDFSVDGQKIRIQYERLEKVTVSYYKMDLELLFSRSPFLAGSQTSSLTQFSSIKPNVLQEVSLPGEGSSHEVEIPTALAQTDTMVEVCGAGLRRSIPHFANSLRVRVMEGYGQLKVCDAESGKPLPATYVKCYAQMRNGSTKFHKDGYTDRRGRFDYASLSTGSLSSVAKFSLFVSSLTNGAVVKDTPPPAM